MTTKAYTCARCGTRHTHLPDAGYEGDTLTDWRCQECNFSNEIGKEAEDRAKYRARDAAPAMLAALQKVHTEIMAHWTLDDLAENHCGMDVAFAAVRAAIVEATGTEHHPLAIGTRILSVKGEEDNDGETQRYTGPNAIGIVDATHAPAAGDRGHVYSVHFEPSGVSVFLDQFGELDTPDYQILPS